LLKRSILTEKLARRGQHIAREYSVDVFELRRVVDVMDRAVPTVAASTTVGELADRIASGDPEVAKRQATIVLDNHGALHGVVSRGDLMKALQDGSAATSLVGDIACKEV